MESRARGRRGLLWIWRERPFMRWEKERFTVISRVRETLRRWPMFSPGDLVVAAVSGGADSLVLLDVLVDRLVRAGVRPGNIIIWADSERSLFSAGISLRGDAGKVRVLGADSTGYRDGVSRILLDDCDLMINVARLRPDPRFGMCGAVANLLACLPPEDRAAFVATDDEVLEGAGERFYCTTLVVARRGRSQLLVRKSSLRIGEEGTPVLVGVIIDHPDFVTVP